MTKSHQQPWVEDEVSFVADGLTIHGTYRHQKDAAPAPAALLISESGNTDRNGDNAVAGPIGNMRQLAELPVGPRASPACATTRSAPARPALARTQQQPDRRRQRRLHRGRQGRGALPRRPAGHRQGPASRSTALGEGTIHAMALAADTTPGAPKIHSLGLFQPLSGPLPGHHHQPGAQQIDADVKAGAKTRSRPTTCRAWTAAVDEVRTKGTVPAQAARGARAPSSTRAT